MWNKWPKISYMAITALETGFEINAIIRLYLMSRDKNNIIVLYIFWDLRVPCLWSEMDAFSGPIDSILEKTILRYCIQKHPNEPCTAITYSMHQNLRHLGRTL